jgi:nitrilase
VLAGPARDGEAILTADLDLDEIARGTFDLDVVGHYARPDVFRLTVDDRPSAPVAWETERPSA